MEKPTECRWCGAEVRTTEQDTVIFQCGSWHSETEPEHQWIKCRLNVAEKRIQRAVEVLEKRERFVDYTVSGEALEILRGNCPAGDRDLASRLLPDLAMILMGSRVGKTKSMPWLNVCRELGLTLKDLTDEIKRQGETDGQAD